MAIEWVLFPHYRVPSDAIRDTVKCFEANEEAIASSTNYLKSNDVLKVVANDLSKIGYQVETGRSTGEKVGMPVLYGDGGVPLKEFFVDAFNPSTGIVVEVEAGQALSNFRFLKDIFEASAMLEAKYLCMAVRQIYQSNRNSRDYEKIKTYLEVMYSSDRLSLPLEGILLIGY